MDNNILEKYKEKLAGLSDQEREVALNILKQYQEQGKSDIYNQLVYEDYAEIPVDIHEFLHNKKYLGNALYDQEGRFTLFSYWEKVLEDIFPTNITTKYNTLILTGSIGIGKSTVAVVCLLYMLYRLLCLKDPYVYYGMQPVDKISISLMNITIENAKGVALDKMNQMLLSSEWFMGHGRMSGTTNLTYLPDKHIELIVASGNNQVIGRALFANFSDEVNWGITTDTEKLKQKYKQLVSQIDARMKSRFMRQKGEDTYLPTLNIIASSKNNEQSFLEEYIDTKKRNESKNTLIIDEPQWVVDSRKDSDIKFYVAIGNKYLANELLPLDCPKELRDEYQAKGYNLLAVPIGYLENFRENIDGALMDIAGIATAASTKYISGVRWNEIKTALYDNPFTKEIIEVGTAKDDTSQYYDYFDLSKVPDDLKMKPLFIHLDMSKKQDKTGIGGVYVLGKRPKIEGEDSSRELYFRVAFNVSVKAPKGYEISFDKHRIFIKWLREQGFNIQGVSSDTYQAGPVQQQLAADGFNTKIISVDRLDPETKTCLPYTYLKSTIYERRLEVYKECDFLTEEVLGLERQSDGHINHPEGGTKGCFTGDTLISLVDGRELSLLELVDEYKQGKKNYVYSFNETTKKIEPKLIEKAWCTIKDAELVEVTLDNNEKIRCTPNHLFMLRDGSYCEAKDLQVSDSLMPLYRKYLTKEQSPLYEYRLYYEPIEDKWHYEHRSFCVEEYSSSHEIVHHKNCNKKDNSPDNLIYCSKNEHLSIHADLSTGMKSPEAIAKKSKSITNWHIQNKNTEAYKNRSKKLHEANLRQHGRTEEDYLLRQEKLQQQHLNGQRRKELSEINKQKKRDYIESIEKLFNIKWADLSANERDSYGLKFQRYNHPETVEHISNCISTNHKAGKYINAKKALAKCNDESKKLKELCPDVDKEKFFEIFGFEYDSLDCKHKASWVTKYRKIVCKDILNHKVICVKTLPYREDVYDLTIQDNHNFALAAGVFVHNSKDAIDAICGSLWNASQHADEYAYNYGESYDSFLSTNEKNTQYELQQQLLVDFENELKNLQKPIASQDQNNNNNQQPYILDDILIW